MLDAFIIEELKKREEQRQDEQRPVLELPLESPTPKIPANEDKDSERESDRGVVIIDL